MSTDVPLASNAMAPTFKIENRPVPPGKPEPQAGTHMASQNYFRTLGIPLRKGRAFDNTDNADAPPVVIINESLAKQHWGDEDPLGKRVQLSGMGSAWRTIVGVVGDVKDKGLKAQAGPAIYLPMLQAPVYQIQLFVQTTKAPLQVVPDIRAIVRSLDPEQPIADIETLDQVRSDSLAPSRLTAALIGLFAALAFAITAIGISGVITSYVTERTREIGIRMALGARKQDVMGMVLRQGMTVVAIGLVLGIAASLLLTKLLSSLLFGVQPTDPLTFGAVSIVLIIVVGLSCLIPARRAAIIEPLLALRS
jgi:predicted permease